MRFRHLWRATLAVVFAVACGLSVAQIERVVTDMDLVREDAGSNWVENRFGYRGQQMRGEVMDAGIQADHGDRDGDGDAKGTGHLAQGAAVKLTWSMTADAAFDLFEESAGVLYEDPDAFADGQSWYYNVRATDAWGNEGP